MLAGELPLVTALPFMALLVAIAHNCVAETAVA